MSEELPEHLKEKLVKKMWIETLRRMKEERRRQEIDIEKLVWDRLADDRAREFLEKTKSLYPDAYPHVIRVLASLILRGMVKELDGLTVLSILRRLGLDIRPELRIKFVKRGKEVSFKEYVGD